MKPIIIKVSATRRFELDKPRYNPYQTGHGVHKSKKTYTRKVKHKGLNLD